MTIREAFETHGRTVKLRRSNWPKGHWVWWHTGDACLYCQSGLLHAFGRLSAEDQIADDWEVVNAT